MKINNIKMLLSSILIIIPTIISTVFSDEINGKIAIHWGIDGNSDGYVSPLLFVILCPVLLVAVQWLCVWITAKTNSKNQNKKVMEIVYWICPAISIYMSFFMLSVMLGYELNLFTLTFIFFGVLFAVIGNYIPKCTQNSTIGIKIRWTLSNQENWNTTHRFAGKVWFVGGVVLLLCVFVPADISIYLFFAILFTMIALPFAYSYNNYKTQLKEGRATKSDFKLSSQTKRTTIITAIIVALALIFVFIIMFTGEVNTTLSDNSILIECTFYSDMTIYYDDIKEINYTDDLRSTRIGGFGSPRLSLGMFKSEELGNISAFCYTQNKSAVVITTNNDRIIVVNRHDKNRTSDLYNEISKKIGEQ